MMDSPYNFNLKGIFRLIDSEEEAVKFFQYFGIIPEERLCDKGHSMILCFGPRIKWRCNKSTCRSEKGIKTGNWLEGSRLKMETVVHFIYCWSRELTSCTFCDRELNMSKEAFIDYSNCMREVCVWKIESLSSKIGGDGMYVELDVTMFTKRKSNTSSPVLPLLVLGGICRETNECFLVPVPDGTEQTLLDVIMEKIKPGSIVVSDCWRGIQDLFIENTHFLADQAYSFVDPQTLQNSDVSEKLWGSAKWGSKKRRGTDKNYLTSYLAEFMWRQRLGGKDPFLEILKDIKSFSECNAKAML